MSVCSLLQISRSNNRTESVRVRRFGFEDHRHVGVVSENPNGGPHVMPLISIVRRGSRQNYLDNLEII
jgi:hypothetical protein